MHVRMIEHQIERLVGMIEMAEQRAEKRGEDTTELREMKADMAQVHKRIQERHDRFGNAA